MAKYPALINACNQISIDSFPIEIIPCVYIHKTSLKLIINCYLSKKNLVIVNSYN